MKGSIRVIWRLPLVLLVVFAGMFALPTSAHAHAKLLRSTPADGTNVVSSPKLTELWFSELLDSDFNSITVYAAAEVNAKVKINLADGDAKVDPKDKTHLTVALKNLPPGEYIVDWRVLSLDGHSAPGRFKFRVSAPKPK